MLVSNHLQIWSGGFSRRGGGILRLLKPRLQDLKKRRVLRETSGSGEEASLRPCG